MMVDQDIDKGKYIRNNHKIYSSSILNLGVSPEYNIGEVSLAALYRQVGWQVNSEGKLSRFSEGRVKTETSSFFKKVEKTKKSEELSGNLDISDWRLALKEVLSSPKMPKQVKSKYPILYPLVPDCTLYSSASRLRSANPWNPGNLIEIVIQTGSIQNEAELIWKQVFNALSCNPDNENEDIWSRIVSLEFSKWRDPNIIWSINKISHNSPSFNDEIIRESPAAKFVEDLKKVLKLKNSLTRRKWLSVLESLIRIACASHVLWICNLNIIVWDYLKSCIVGECKPSGYLLSFMKNNLLDFWKLDEKAIPIIKNKIQSYIQSKIAINYVLDQFDANNVDKLSFDSVEDIVNLGEIFKEQIKVKGISKELILHKINSIYEIDPKLISCKKGSSANILEFIRHSLGQKQTAELQKRSFDQSYWLRKNGSYSSAPWVVEIGPTSILTMVYCCSYGYEQNRTIIDLLAHLNKYGFVINQQELENSNLLNSLTTLQIIGDSPDAEGGMIILNPFANTK